MAERNQASLLPLPSAVTTRKSESASDGAERGAQHPGSHRQGHGQGREDNSKAGVQQSPAQKGNGERQRQADLWKQADRRSTFAAAPPVAPPRGERAAGWSSGPRGHAATAHGGQGRARPAADRWGEVYLREAAPTPVSS
jgi:hypothetical protein